MSPNKASCSRVKVTELQEFLRDPPPGFLVEPLEGDSCGYRVHSDPEINLILIDDSDSFCRGKIVFQNSLGRTVRMHNLWEYTSLRKSLLSKRIYLLTSACKYNCDTNNNRAKDEFEVVNQYVVCINGSDPLIKWQMARGLDWTISSVAGESYTVEIDLTEALQSWATTNSHVCTDKLIKAEPVWRDAAFTLKYHSDALFDFPYWFGFSKRSFKVKLT
ncbi:mesenteric estrogen-dependent adipogenesis protein [Cynoglossus semilaevis]|uniref:Mesenteric estrogen dependent adipogenesis n=1 Tax=Cynoglossus semilaevis TaxID=244447 RepID=A0A3P8VZL0_CYNSE|nr:mesenteric estrogen-dependent adipogenesis protein [Cynoglossus semilaevis]XP_024921279.1 mesenteric estrogen-dependent adipogenesis protein [Cynoglossus semilaevis]